MMVGTRLVLPRARGLLRKMFVVGCRMAVIVAIMVKSNAVELLKRIHNFAHGSCKTRVKRDALDSRSANVNTLALLDVSEVGCFDPMTLVWNNGRFRVTQKRPLCCAEEGSSLDVRSTSTRSESSRLIFDKQFANEGLAEAVCC